MNQQAKPSSNEHPLGDELLRLLDTHAPDLILDQKQQLVSTCVLERVSTLLHLERMTDEEFFLSGVLHQAIRYAIQREAQCGRGLTVMSKETPSDAPEVNGSLHEQFRHIIRDRLLHLLIDNDGKRELNMQKLETLPDQIGVHSSSISDLLKINALSIILSLALKQ